MAARARRPRLLVLQDDALVVRALDRFLGDDFDLVVVDDVERLYVLLHDAERFDAILCDGAVDAAACAQLYLAIARYAPDQAARILFSAGRPETPELAEFFASIPNRRLDTPVRLEDLNEAVDRILRDRGPAV